MSASTAAAMRLNLALRVGLTSAKIESLLTFQSMSRTSLGNSRSINVPVPARSDAEKSAAKLAALMMHFSFRVNKPSAAKSAESLADSSTSHEQKRNADENH